MVTTAETLAAERQIIDLMNRGQGRAEPILSGNQWQKIESQSGHLNESQRKAVREVLETHDRVMGIQGFAGKWKDHGA